METVHYTYLYVTILLILTGMTVARFFVLDFSWWWLVGLWPICLIPVGVFAFYIYVFTKFH